MKLSDSALRTVAGYSMVVFEMVNKLTRQIIDTADCQDGPADEPLHFNPRVYGVPAVDIKPKQKAQWKRERSGRRA